MRPVTFECNLGEGADRLSHDSTESRKNTLDGEEEQHSRYQRRD